MFRKTLHETDEIKKEYTHFNIIDKTFSNVKGSNIGGVPLMYCNDNNTKKVFVDSTDTHTLVFGSTGSMKTRTIVMPTIKILGYAGESMIINDSKGELYYRHAVELEHLGYNVKVINFRNPLYGNSWNPLFIPYLFYKSGDIDKSCEFANDICVNLMEKDEVAKDPFWDNSASDLFYGLIILLFKYCVDNNLGLEYVNIGNIIEIRHFLFSNTSKPKDSWLWKYAQVEEIVNISLSGTIYAPDDTKNSILSVFDQRIRTFSINPTLLNMLSSNDIKMEDFGEVKSAVFLITPDEKTVFHKLVSLFVKQSYEYIIFNSTKNENSRVRNRINYILDEFSSLPTIPDMPSMISAARSRDIKFLLVVQSQSSLVKRYNYEAETIISNCANWVFFTSREIKLLKELSELCGNDKNNSPNISVYDLQHLKKDKCEALILAGRLNPCIVQMLDIDKFRGKKFTAPINNEIKRVKRKKIILNRNNDEQFNSIDKEIEILLDNFDKDLNNGFEIL